MAFYGIDTVLTASSKDLTQIFQSAALRVHISGFERVNDESLGLAGAESSFSLARPNSVEWNLCEHLICFGCT